MGCPIAADATRIDFESAATDLPIHKEAIQNKIESDTTPLQLALSDTTLLSANMTVAGQGLVESKQRSPDPTIAITLVQISSPDPSIHLI